MFVFALMLALFIALTGGYGQVINSDWVTRSFTSAEEVVNAYPVLEVGTEYLFQFHTQVAYSGKILEQNDNWVYIKRTEYQNAWVNLENVAYFYAR